MADGRRLQEETGLICKLVGLIPNAIRSLSAEPEGSYDEP